MKDVWNVKEILGKDNSDSIINTIKSDVDKFKKYKSRLDSLDEKSMLELLLLKEKITENMMRIESYYSLRFYENTKDNVATAKLSMLKQLGTELGNETMFFALWFMKLEDKKANRLINSEKTKPFKHYLERIRELKDYTLTEDVEKIINLKDIASSGFFDIYEHITSGFEYDFDGKTIGEEELRAKCRDQNPKIREKAYTILLEKYALHKSELSEIYRNIVLDWYNEDVNIRHYPTSISSRNMNNDLDDKTIDALLNVIRRNNKLFQEYFKLKHSMINKRLSKDKQFKFSRFHLYAPYNVKLQKYDYEYSKKYVLETLKQFDVRFFDAAKSIFDAKHVHSHPQKNKRGGAFCMNITNKYLPYIMLNHTDDVRDMFTLAHEFGHGIHDVLSMKQPNLLQHAPLPLCETASIFSEMILADRMLKESKNDEEKKYILMNLLDNQYASINRQAYFVIFEMFVHENIVKGIDVKNLDTEYLRLLKEQFGSMQVPELFKNEWNYIPHIHETPFYCYSYAFGNLLVLSLYDMYRKELEKGNGREFIDKYVKILAAGGSVSPKELLSKIGIDLSSEEFWQRGFNIIKEEVKELEKLK
jgi:oligoendopeptidase F